jgi:2-polyprenyl-6-methoxyphenol hydroxylase-like FAD-dependent oxidoreductase
MTESPAAVFDRLVTTGPPSQAPVLFDVACVLGGSIAGLAAARVLADRARRVIVVESDVAGEEGRPRAGVPQGRQVHVLLPGGHAWMERWLPGLTGEMLDRGAQLIDPGQFDQYLDGHLQVSGGERQMVAASRPFVESRVRARVLAQPNVSAVQARATGLEYRGGRVSGVRYESDGGGAVLQADFVVDAMGRASRLPDWLSADGYDKPALARLPIGINYASARFKRVPGQGTPFTGARFSPPYPVNGVTGSAAVAIEDDQWLVTLMSYDDMRPGRGLDIFRETCKRISHGFAEAVSAPLIGDVATYHQADSRRRDFTGLARFPAGLVSVGDAAASFNPMYGQGMSAAALHGSCLAEYLQAGDHPAGPAAGFFALQKVVTDAAWAMSAGADGARLDALNGNEVPEEVRLQREAFGQIVQATITDETVAARVNEVAYMLAHPGTLADPALLERAVAANRQAAAGSLGG